jgi:hypothetical protein
MTTLSNPSMAWQIGKQARMRPQKLDPEPVHLWRTLEKKSINKNKK